MTDEQGESLQERLDRIGAEAEAEEAEALREEAAQVSEHIQGYAHAEPADGILGKDFLGGADPVDVVREMRDGDPVAQSIVNKLYGSDDPAGGYIPTSSEQETVDLARKMTGNGRVATPVKFEADKDDMAMLTFGPMPFEDLMSMLEYLGSPEGSVSFLESLAGAMTENAAQAQEG